MPEASVHLYHRSVFRKHNVRAAWQIRTMQAESKASAVKESTNSDFRPRVLAANAGHHPTPRQLVDDVRHR